jgi:hypothetical protein
MQYSAESGPLEIVLAAVSILACGVVVWKSVDYIREDRRRRRERQDREPRI